MPPCEPWNSSAAPLAMLARALVLLASVAPAVPSQEKAPALVAPTPSITLLLREPRALDAAHVRTEMKRILGVVVESKRSEFNAYVLADGEALVGQTVGVAWRVEVEAKPHALPPSSTRHLIVSDAEELTEHLAQLHVRCTTPCADDGAKATAYRAVARVAAALLARDVMAIGAAEHGTFDVVDGDVDATNEELLGDDPLDALRPVQSTSFVLFLSAPRTLEADAVAAAFTREWKRPISGGEGDADATEFVIDARGTLLVKIGDELMQIGAREVEGASEKDLARYEDLRMRHVMQKQRQLVRFFVAGEPTPEQEAARRRLVARAAAALWGDDVLAASWHCDRRLAYPREGLVQDLRAEDPVAASLRDPLVPVLEAPDEAAMQAAIEKARSEWATAKAHFEKGGEVFVKFPFATRTKGHEHMWVRVTRIDGDSVHGELGNDPVDVEGLKRGSVVVRERGELSDWLFERDGKQVGGYTLEALAKPKAAGSEPKADEEKPKAEGSKPKSDESKPKSDGAKSQKPGGT